MKKLILLLLVFALALVSDFMPNDTSIMNPDPFYFHDFGTYEDGTKIGIVFQTYVYMISQHIALLIIFFVLAKEETEYRGALWLFFGLNCADFVDFLASYNTTWFHYHGFPITMNVTMCVVFLLVIIREAWNRYL